MEPGGPETCVEFIFFWFSTYLLPWFSLLNVSTHIKQCNRWKISSQMKLKQLLLVHSDFPTLLYIGGKQRTKNSAAAASSLDLKKHMSTYKWVPWQFLRQFCVCTFVCVGWKHTGGGCTFCKNNTIFSKTTQLFSELGPVLLEQLCVCGRALAVALKLIKTSLTLNCIFMPC